MKLSSVRWGKVVFFGILGLVALGCNTSEESSPSGGGTNSNSNPTAETPHQGTDVPSPVVPPAKIVAPNLRDVPGGTMLTELGRIDPSRWIALGVDPSTVGASQGLEIQLVRASEGGEIVAVGGRARVTIPRGALFADTVVALRELDSTSQVASKIYELVPTNLKPNLPLDVGIQFDGSVPQGKLAVLAWLDDAENKWAKVEGSKLEGGKVVGKVTHFAKFAVVFANAEVPVAKTCGDIVSSFRACGGDLKGIWVFEETCLMNSALGSNPYGQVCPDAKMGVDVKFGQTVTIDATTLRVAPGTQTVGMTLTLPKTCLANMGPGASSLTCDSFGQAVKMPCADSGDACSCSKAETQPSDGSVETYTVSGNTFATMKDGKPGKSKEYCVSGDILTIKELDDKGQSMVYQLKRTL